MKQLLLALIWFSGVAVAAVCEPPKPFQSLKSENAAVYAYDAVVLPLKKTVSSDSAAMQQPGHKPKLVNLWASWCAPCRKELPLLDQLATQGIADVELINIDDTVADAKALLDSLNIQQLTTEFADYDLLTRLSIAGLPATIVYAPSQTFVGVGIIKDEAKLRAWLTCLTTTQAEEN